MIAAARTRKRVVSGIAPEEGWASVDDATGGAIDVTTTTDEVDNEVDEVDMVDEADEADEVDDEMVDEVDEINWGVIEDTAVVTSVMELAPTRVREKGKLSPIVT